MKFAVINPQNVVVNIVVADPGYTSPDGLRTIASDAAKIGDVFDGTNFISPPPLPITPQMQAIVDAAAAVVARRATMDAEADQSDLLQRLRTATPAQIDTWLTNNVTNLAQARTVLGAIVKYLAKNA